jgi:hypothetical protein
MNNNEGQSLDVALGEVVPIHPRRSDPKKPTFGRVYEKLEEERRPRMKCLMATRKAS